MKVEKITPQVEVTIEKLHDYIAECCSVVRDKTPKNSERLFNRLLVESVGDKPSRVLEYIPIVISFVELERYSTAIHQLFGFFCIEKQMYYTNMREALNFGFSLDELIKFVDFSNYEVYKCEAPYFIYGQVSTHNQLTTVSHSQRYSKCERGYWKPEEIPVSKETWDFVVQTSTPNELSNYMKEHGVVRKEVFDRGSDMLQNRVFTIGGYTNNKNAWGHFLKQRLDSHTQKETRDFVRLFL